MASPHHLCRHNPEGIQTVGWPFRVNAYEFFISLSLYTRAVWIRNIFTYHFKHTLFYFLCRNIVHIPYCWDSFSFSPSTYFLLLSLSLSFFHLSWSLSVFLFSLICLSVFLSFCLSVYLSCSVSLFCSLSFCLSVSLSLSLNVSLISLSFCLF